MATTDHDGATLLQWLDRLVGLARVCVARATGAPAPDTEAELRQALAALLEAAAAVKGAWAAEREQDREAVRSMAQRWLREATAATDAKHAALTEREARLRAELAWRDERAALVARIAELEEQQRAPAAAVAGEP